MIPEGIWTECWQCGGEGRLAGCFVDTCDCGGEDDPDECCAPRRCDICKGKGGWRDLGLSPDNGGGET